MPDGLPSPPLLTRHLDHRAALAVLLLLQLSVLVVTPTVWREVVSFWGIRADHLKFTEPWMLSLCMLVGFWCALGPGNWLGRIIITLVACGWAWTAFFCGHNLVDSSNYSLQLGFVWGIASLLAASGSAAIFATISRLTGMRLQHTRQTISPTRAATQFRLQELMLAVLMIGATFGAARWAGPISIPPPSWFVDRFWDQLFLPMTMLVVLAVCSILTAFSKVRVTYFLLFVAPPIILLNVLSFLVLYVPLPQWPREAVPVAQQLFVCNAIVCGNCIGTMLLIRWLGYELRPLAR